MGKTGVAGSELAVKPNMLSPRYDRDSIIPGLPNLKRHLQRKPHALAETAFCIVDLNPGFNPSWAEPEEGAEEEGVDVCGREASRRAFLFLKSSCNPILTENNFFPFFHQFGIERRYIRSCQLGRLAASFHKFAKNSFTIFLEPSVP